MDGTLLKHKHEIIEMVNHSIMDLYSEFKEDGELDPDEVDELKDCLMILKYIAKIRYLDHEIKMDMHEAHKKGNPTNPGMDAGGMVEGTAEVHTIEPQPHGHGYGTVHFTTLK